MVIKKKKNFFTRVYGKKFLIASIMIITTSILLFFVTLSLPVIVAIIIFVISGISFLIKRITQKGAIESYKEELENITNIDEYLEMINEDIDYISKIIHGSLSMILITKYKDNKQMISFMVKHFVKNISKKDEDSRLAYIRPFLNSMKVIFHNISQKINLPSLERLVEDDINVYINFNDKYINIDISKHLMNGIQDLIDEYYTVYLQSAKAP